MKKRSKKRLSGKVSQLNDFARGFVSAGLLSAAKQRAKGRAFNRRTVLRHALQGGVALAAAVAAGHAAQRRDYAALAVTAALGAAGVFALDDVLRPQPRKLEFEKE
ncbi:MAG: hypothetical protein LBU76_04225 [Azoarcus sp.]|jgi:hypothetical protein|nr:hypothetical protein [Azoarcus sp.]